jgi:hypothetical protein
MLMTAEKCNHEFRRKSLTVTVQVNSPCGIGVKLEFGVVLMHVPTNVAENLGILFLGEGVDTGDLLNLPRLK